MNYYKQYDNIVEIIENKGILWTKDEIDFYQHYFSLQSKILELGCGNGRLLIPFFQNGFNILGLETSQNMIKLAKIKYPSIPIIQGDLTNFKIDQKFDIIILPNNTYNLIDPKLLAGMFESISNHLNKNGIIIIDIWNINKKYQIPNTPIKSIDINYKTNENINNLIAIEKLSHNTSNGFLEYYLNIILNGLNYKFLSILFYYFNEKLFFDLVKFNNLFICDQFHWYNQSMKNFNEINKNIYILKNKNI